MINDKLKAALKHEAATATDKAAWLQSLRDFIHAELSPQRDPIDNVRWVPIEQVQANDYNPNSVALNEMRLLHTSISHDGYTQPVVAIYDEAIKKYVIVDGFHRYTTMRRFKDISEPRGNCLPVVVIEKPINDRMASTIRHNRARGKHSIAGMGSMVFNLLKNKWTDEQICAELGLEPDELLRLKHITGFSKLFKDATFSLAWETERQIKIRTDYEKKQTANTRTKTQPANPRLKAGRHPAVLAQPAQQ